VKAPAVAIFTLPSYERALGTIINIHWQLHDSQITRCGHVVVPRRIET